ncbi:MAG TPA: phosphoribosylformylglycinamidine synthase I [Candidatus Omnitrophica bacterium]|nr:phosphoribosylformylglycinamidine synthase I [Candidatus Omnitrophota bacterium]
MRPKVLILRTAGTNCDKETEFAFRLAGADTYLYHINRVKEEKNITSYQILCLPGGFSYGDNLGAGKIFSLEILLWFKEEIEKFLSKGGLILGICNGFQILLKSGILPHLDFRQKATLTFNDSGRFEDRWVYLKVTSSSAVSLWFKDLPPLITLPVAHGEGKFYADSSTLKEIEDNNQVVLRYVDKSGKLAPYPYNPNGSLNGIAGISDSTGRVLGLMPHPERFLFPHHHPHWEKDTTYPFGRKIFENVVNYFNHG